MSTVSALILVDETDVLAVRMLRGMPREYLDQGLRIRGRRVRIGGGGPARRGSPSRSLGRPGSPEAERIPRARRIPGPVPVQVRCRGRDRLEGTEELAWGLGLGQRPIRETCTSRPLQAREELHPRKAVEAKVAGEVGVEIDAGGCLAGAKLARDVGDERDQGIRVHPGRGAVLSCRLARRLLRHPAVPRARPLAPRRGGSTARSDSGRADIGSGRRPVSRPGGAGARRRGPRRRSTGSRCSGKGSPRGRRAPLPRPGRGCVPGTRARS